MSLQSKTASDECRDECRVEQNFWPLMIFSILCINDYIVCMLSLHNMN